MKKRTSLLLAACMVVALAACGGSGTTTGEAAAPQIPENAGNTTAAAPEPADSGSVIITHEYGETEVPTNPEKVLVMDYGVIDILRSVGVELGGIPQGSMPAYLSSLREEGLLNTGTLQEIDFEAVAEYGPDLIIITGRLSSTYDECSEIAPTIYLPMPGAAYMDTLAENVETLSKIFTDKAGDLQAGYDSLADVAAGVRAEAQAAGLTALVVMANDSNISFFSAGSRYGMVFDALGFTPVADDIEDSTHGAEGSFEYFTEVDPDVIFVIDRSAAISGDGESGAAALLVNQLVNATSAAQNGRIIYLSSDVWYLASGGFEGTAQMIAEVAEALG